MTKTNEATEATEVTPIAPSETGIAHLRTIDPGAMRLWTVKGPKGTDSTIAGVLLDTDTPAVVILHQFANGKFATFVRASL